MNKKQFEQKQKPAKHDLNDDIKQFEDELSKTKYNKKTQHHFALVKAKIARLKERVEQRKKSGPHTEGYAVKRSGDATVVLVGFPSVGKSTLLNNLTNADSKVAAYEFTTLTVIPGLLNHKGAKIQILDVPGIMKGAASGTGRGKEVISVMRSADLLLIMIEATNLKQLEVLNHEIYDARLRMNQHKPDVKIVKTTKGGIDIGATVKLTKLTEEMICDILKEFRMMNVQIVLREDIDADQLIDVIEGNKKYLPAIVTVNKIDMVDEQTIHNIQNEISPDLMISAESRINLDRLIDMIYDKLDFIRIYTKEVNKPADLHEPLIMKRGTAIRDVCLKLHKDFVAKFRFARLWGSSKFPGQMLKNLEREVKDQDIVEIHVK